MGLRTDGRMDRNDVISKPKFLAFTGHQILLAMGLRCARLRRARELRYKDTKFYIVIQIKFEVCHKNSNTKRATRNL